MKRSILVLTILLFSTTCFAADKEWKTKDKVLLGSYYALSSLDAYQTSTWNRKNMQEANPLFRNKEGKVNMTTVVGYKVLTGIGLYFLADYFPKYRTPILGVAVGLQGGAVVWNSQF